jgi:hypothetical protein
MASPLQARVVTANGLPFGVLEAGRGPLALCLHGFPDSAGSARERQPGRGQRLGGGSAGDGATLSADGAGGAF